MRIFRRLLPLLLLALPAGGCAVPPALTIASLAADGASYAATGKSVTDHGISAATSHDCALLRPVIDNKPVCDTTLTAQGKEVPVVAGTASVPRPGLAAAPAPLPVPATSYVTLGSFVHPDNAVRLAAHYADVKATVVPVQIDGRRYYRVIAGPLSREAADALKLRLAAL